MNEPTHQDLLGAAMLALDACTHRIANQDTEIARLRAEVETLWSRNVALTDELRRRVREGAAS